MSKINRIYRYLRRSGIRNHGSSYPSAVGVPTAVRAECTCPDFCERDHDNE